ncbi:hypothetical protein TELCIR_09706 [Teladorsagia circumcincta]|uniref:Uncharacterized protein n=1 Tax=Teladorsagia circumcincta TaxID=45464 RepID=A0A2G9UE26_TELCI|nr:hypothetical protein TELCIR_09706 [Teladorsagia circumcincta]
MWSALQLDYALKLIHNCLWRPNVACMTASLPWRGSASAIVVCIPRPTLPKRSINQKKDQKSGRSAETTPRSPLMTVARTVKSKFSKLTRMGRHEQDVSMKGSQSFSGEPRTTVTQTHEKTSGAPGKVTISEEHEVVHVYDEGDKIAASIPQSPDHPSVPDTVVEEKVQSPETEVARTVLHSCLKTPQCARKHHTFALGEKIPDTSSELRAVEPIEARARSEEKESPKVREVSPATRFLISIKTPEALRKHKAFFIGQGDPLTKATEDENSQPRRKKQVKIVKQRSMPERSSVSPERYILTVKTPEALRRHHTFTIRERPKSPDVPYIEEGEITEPIATVGPTAEKSKTDKEREAKRVSEGKALPNKITMALRTPFTMRKCKTFAVEGKTKEGGVPSSKSADAIAHSKVEATEEPKAGATPHTKRKMKTTEDDVENEHTEKFILTTATTPKSMRKVQTFMIEDKPRAEEPARSQTIGNIEAIATLEKQEELNENVPLKTSDMYVLTTMTPLTQRKEPVDSHLERLARERATADSHLERLARERARGASRSPEKVSLFIMKGRSTPRVSQQGSEEEISPRFAIVPPQRNELELDAIRRERSQSDRAEFIERKNSDTSDEMTSPEEEIPMDTHLTPTEELRDDTLIIRPIRRPPEVTSPIAEEPEMSINGTPIVETKLSPVKLQRGKASSASCFSTSKPTQGDIQDDHFVEVYVTVEKARKL